MPGQRVLYRETYAADGLVRRLGADGQVLAEHRFSRSPAAASNLSPDTSKLLMLPLPLRSSEHVHAAYRADLSKGYGNLRPDTREALLATIYASHNSGEAAQVFLSIHAKDRRPLGYYTVLAACGVNVNNKTNGVDVLAEYPNEPLARYLAFQSNPQRKQGTAELADIGGPREGFVQRPAEAPDPLPRLQAWFPLIMQIPPPPRPAPRSNLNSLKCPFSL